MKFLIILLVSIQLFASHTQLNKKQKHTLMVANYIGSKIFAHDGMNFGHALQGIALAESSAGLCIIGDKYKNGKLKSLYDSSLGAFQIKLSTAKFIIRKTPILMHRFHRLLKNDKVLVNLLLTEPRFSAEIAGHYLRLMYNEAKHKKLSNPYFRTISKYNGSWNNVKYYKRVKSKMKWMKTYYKSIYYHK